MNTKLSKSILTALGSLFALTGAAFAQTTAFTYQGRLFDGGSPANGSYDLQFTLYDDPNVGNQLGPVFATNGVTVVNGVFTLALDFGAVFDGTGRWLEVAERANGAPAFATLAPRQFLAAAPYAAFASGVNAAGIRGTIPATSIGSGTITSSMLAPGAVTAASIANNTITAAQLAPGAAAASLAASGQGGLPSGAMVLSANANDVNLLNASYVRLGKMDLADAWGQGASGAAPSPRDGHTAVWTGSEMIIWGGTDGVGDLNDGARFNPAANSWTTLPTTGAPSARRAHTAVWTGTQMIVWGGYSGLPGLGQYYSDGAGYDPAKGIWSPVSTQAAPSARSSHTALWTGTQMIVWGGEGANGDLGDGGSYQPGSGSWRPVNTGTAPAARHEHTAVWTGSQMIVWGGLNTDPVKGDTPHNDGACYNPVSDSWTAVTTTRAPAARYLHTAVWADPEMIVWGGTAAGSAAPYGDGGRYNPSADNWRPVGAAGGWPAARCAHTAVWTGAWMIVWGGVGGVSPNSISYNDGEAYMPMTDSWILLQAATDPSVPPSARYRHTAVWTGTEMIVWGGQGALGLDQDGARYNPANDMWTPVSTSGAPSGRINHVAVWTGSEMIVWGGWGGRPVNYLNDGGRYSPATDGWTAMAATNAPSGRVVPAAVWTGTQMVIWGGEVASTAANPSGNLNDTYVYSPTRALWLYQRP